MLRQPAKKKNIYQIEPFMRVLLKYLYETFVFVASTKHVHATEDKITLPSEADSMPTAPLAICLALQIVKRNHLKA